MFSLLSLGGMAMGAFETWTNKEGKSVELELINVTEVDGQKVGEFRMRNGKTAKLKASDLALVDASRLDEWKPAEGAAGGAASSGSTAATPYDKYLDRHLVALNAQGSRFTALKEFKKPQKYYLFYYTASWCGPCQKFTPSLVEFYQKHNKGNGDFEIILVTSDSNEDSMEKYASEKKMIWPQVKMGKAADFKKDFKHPGGGIPNLVLTDTEGKLLKTSYEGDKYLGPHAVMSHLESLLQ